jgi:hypothetical protein
LVRRYLLGIPDLAKALSLSREFGLSREAGARRYVELHEQPAALVFSAEGVVRYPDFTNWVRFLRFSGRPIAISDWI